MELVRDEAVDIIKEANKLAAEQKFYEAIDMLERGLTSYRDNRKIMYNLAKYYFKVNNFGKTVEHVGNYLAQDKKNKYAYYLGGAAFFRMMDYKNSILYLENALKIDQNFVEAHFALAITCRKKGDIDEAIRGFEKVVSLNPDHGQARFELSELRKLKK